MRRTLVSSIEHAPATLWHHGFYAITLIAGRRALFRRVRWADAALTALALCANCAPVAEPSSIHMQHTGRSVEEDMGSRILPRFLREGTRHAKLHGITLLLEGAWAPKTPAPTSSWPRRTPARLILFKYHSGNLSNGWRTRTALYRRRTPRADDCRLNFDIAALCA